MKDYFGMQREDAPNTVKFSIAPDLDFEYELGTASESFRRLLATSTNPALVQAFDFFTRNFDKANAMDMLMIAVLGLHSQINKAIQHMHDTVPDKLYIPVNQLRLFRDDKPPYFVDEGVMAQIHGALIDVAKDAWHKDGEPANGGIGWKWYIPTSLRQYYEDEDGLRYVG